MKSQFGQNELNISFDENSVSLWQCMNNLSRPILSDTHLFGHLTRQSLHMSQAKQSDRVILSKSSNRG